MKLVLAAALVTALAFLGSRLPVLKRRLASVRWPLGVQNLLLSGTEFVLVGLVLGHAGLGILDQRTLTGLFPFVGMGLAWIGLLFGVQWEARVLRSLSSAGVAPALGQSLVTGMAVAIPFYFLFDWLFPLERGLALIGAVAVGAAASDTAHSGLALVVRHLGGADQTRRQPAVQLLRYITDLDGLVGVVAIGVAACVPVLHRGQPLPFWLAASVGLGLGVGLLVVLLVAHRVGEDELRLILLGAVLFSGGLSLYLSLSPLLVNLVAGAAIANLAGDRARATIRTALMRGEHAIYVLFLLVVGADWSPGSPTVAGLVAAYLILRTAGKLVGGWLCFWPLRRQLPRAPHLGLGLLSHGGMAIAIVVNLQQIHRSELTDAVISIVLVGVVVSELVSPSLLRRALGRAP